MCPIDLTRVSVRVGLGPLLGDRGAAAEVLGLGEKVAGPVVRPLEVDLGPGAGVRRAVAGLSILAEARQLW
jgi:hypothetical protein